MFVVLFFIATALVHGASVDSFINSTIKCTPSVTKFGITKLTETNLEACRVQCLKEDDCGTIFFNTDTEECITLNFCSEQRVTDPIKETFYHRIDWDPDFGGTNLKPQVTCVGQPLEEITDNQNGVTVRQCGTACVDNPLCERFAMRSNLNNKAAFNTGCELYASPCVEQDNNKRRELRSIVRPTQSPTTSPTLPTEAPTQSPSTSPTKNPTSSPSTSPTKNPTKSPVPPTPNPTNAPSTSPTAAPTGVPSTAPTNAPSESPTTSPTKAPTSSPTEGEDKGFFDETQNIIIVAGAGGGGLLLFSLMLLYCCLCRSKAVAPPLPVNKRSNIVYRATKNEDSDSDDYNYSDSEEDESSDEEGRRRRF